MKVTFNFISLTGHIYCCYSNVDWVRVTGEKIIVHCSDDRNIELRHRKILDFEVTN